MTKQTEKETPKSGQGIQRFRGEWIYASGLIGIISLLVIGIISLLGYDFVDGLLYSNSLLSLVIIIIIALSAFYTYMRKMPAFFILKVSGVAIAASYIIVVGIAVALIALVILTAHPSEPTLWLTKLGQQPESFVEITPQELEKLPTLQSLIIQSRYGPIKVLFTMETTNDEINRINDLIKQKIVEQNYSHEMWVYSSEFGIDDIPVLNNPPITELTTEDLERFPSIKKVVTQSNEGKTVISLDEWNNFQKFTQGHDDQDGIFIKFGNTVYLIRIINTEYSSRSDIYAGSNIRVEGEYYQLSVAPVG